MTIVRVRTWRRAKLRRCCCRTTGRRCPVFYFGRRSETKCGYCRRGIHADHRGALSAVVERKPPKIVRASHLQMAVLHFEKMSRCMCSPRRAGHRKHRCRRCWTAAGAKSEMAKAGIRWVRGVKSDAV